MRKLLATGAAATALAGGLVGVTQAPSLADAGPTHIKRHTACNPKNHAGKITRTSASAGHLHFRVSLVAKHGFACVLAGSPRIVRFYLGSHLLPFSAGHYGPQSKKVWFGPGHPVHFDIQVPNFGATVLANHVTFRLRGPNGLFFFRSKAHGVLVVGPGTLIGPVMHGA
ncbi:hypothetical protein FHU30_001374 [Actinomadura rupiterrae]|nr:hypothetical protein [Actinomadura rupiterrae]